MSSPSETRSQESFNASSQLATSAAYEDTTSSAQGMGTPPGVAVTFVPTALNTSYQWWLKDVRAHSASPQPRQTILLSRLFVAQCYAQIVEQKTASAFFDIGVIADQTHHAQSIAEVAIAEARSVRDEVSSKMAAFAQRVDASTSDVVGMSTNRVEQVATQIEAQMSRVVAQVTQQLEKDIEAIAMKMATMAEIMTRMVVEGLRCNVQAQFK